MAVEINETHDLAQSKQNPLELRLKNAGVDIHLKTGDEIIADPHLLKEIAQCYVDVYNRPEEWGESNSLSEVESTLRKQLASSENYLPMITYSTTPAQIGTKEIRGFSLGLFTDQSHINTFWRGLSYFGGTHQKTIDTAIDTFWKDVPPPGPKIFYSHDTVIRPNYRTTGEWFALSGKLLRKARVEGCKESVGLTSSTKSQFYDLMTQDGINLISPIVQTTPDKPEDAPLVMFYTDKLEVIDQMFYADNPMLFLAHMRRQAQKIPSEKMRIN